VFDSGRKVPKVSLEIATRVLLNIKSHDKVFILGGRSFMYTFIARDHFVGGSETGGSSQDRLSYKHSVAVGRVVPENLFLPRKKIYAYLMETGTKLNDKLIII